ncbi:MAG TPA: benzoate-CoA ligase family protein [Pyrinomonadaceae bacterium]|jgi:benzoate-CoA ligase family|nr:benzoate-CoA ligase family protein [Pyrinomonadaceae bacterium]
MNLFQAICSNNSSSTAIIHGRRRMTYGELREETLSTAQAIALLGVQQGDRVALLLHDSPEFVTAFIATCSLGAIAVPVNMGLRPDEHRLILHNSGAHLALVEADICNTLLTDASERLQDLKDIVVIERGAKTAFRALGDVQREAASSDLPEFVTPVEDQPAFILYTSGSTGDPKGAVHTQAHIFYTNETFCREVLSVNRADRLFSSSRLPFAYGLGNSFSFPLLNGATSILCTEKPTADVVSRVLEENRPTIFFGVPVVYNFLLDHHRRGNKLDCSSLRLCVSAGEALPAHLGEEWENEFGVPVVDGIGSTEMLHMFMSNHRDDVRYGSSGKVLNGYEARLLNEEGETVEQGVGNLWIKGGSAALGYWEKPGETERTFVNGWVRTGDLYRRDDDGYWFHMGRSDDCFKSSGRWVSPVEVEGVLIRHDKVSKVAVVADFDADGLPCPCAFVVCQDVEFEKGEIEKELSELAAASLPRFKRPRRYLFVSELPYTATGKVQRFKLREMLRRSTEGIAK